MAIGNMHKKFGKDRTWDMLVDRHTDRHTHRLAH